MKKKYQIYYEGKLAETIFADSSDEALTEFEDMIQMRIKGLQIFDILESKKDIHDYGKSIMLSLISLFKKKQIKSF